MNFFEKLTLHVQALWFRMVMIGAFCLALLAILAAASSKTPIIIPQEYAPFTEDVQKTLSAEEKTAPLGQPNQSYDDVEAWIIEALSEVLSFSPETFTPHLKEVQGKYFSAGGYAQYTASLQNATLPTLVQQNRFSTRMFLESPPALDAEGAVGGRYSWRFDVPVTISYIPAGQTGTSSGVQNVRALIVVQVGRVLDEKNPFALRIDSWTMTARGRPVQ